MIIILVFDKHARTLLKMLTGSIELKRCHVIFEMTTRRLFSAKGVVSVSVFGYFEDIVIYSFTVEYRQILEKFSNEVGK